MIDEFTFTVYGDPISFLFPKTKAQRDADRALRRKPSHVRAETTLTLVNVSNVEAIDASPST